MYTVEYNLLPNFTNLFLDYISDDAEKYAKVKRFIKTNYRSDEEVFKVIDNKIQNYNSNRYFDKHLLIEILKQQNVTFGGTEITAANIELLNNDNTFAVVTGQQVGLYTGNLYTIYKTITAIKLSFELRNKYKECNFVPIFWLESEDHDLEESDHIHIINKSNDLLRVGFEPEVQEEDEEEPKKKSIRPVGGIQFDESINGLNELLKDSLIETEFKEKIIERITSFYKAGSDYKTSFAQMLNWIFREYGLVFIDPSDVEVKKLLTPIFEKELNTTPKLCEQIISISADIEKDYDLQVKPKVINLFYIHNGNRLLIEPRENDRFALRNSKKRFEREELMNLLFSNPENFSPNVVLRPICQDYLLPTIAYVAGPAEVSYYAQLKPAYQHYELTMPVIYPRVSVTIIENKVKKFLNNFDLKFEDVFQHKIMINKVVSKLSEVKVDDEIAKFYDDFNGIFYNLKTMAGKIDKTLINIVDGIKEKMGKNLETFKAKLINAQTTKSEVTTNQIEKVTNNVFPNRNLQERVINISYFINKYDEEFLVKLFNEIDINNFNHQIIEY
jgi:bacillithiol synthase